MNYQKIFDSLNSCEIAFSCEEMLADYTTFKIGGRASLMVFPTTNIEVSKCCKCAAENNIEYFVLGNGSNLLVSDDGFDGMIINTNCLKSIKVTGESIECGSGVLLSQLCRKALERNLSGAEFAWGIPGSVGGAVYMNAGAYGGEMQDIIKSVTFYENNDIITLSANELDLSYRHSIFADKRAVILSAEFIFKNDVNADIKARMDEYLSRRKSKQPLEYPSAGSTFKRPAGNYAAALIDEAGLSGYKFGGAMVSEKHCGFVINYNNASCKDILSIVDYIKQEVRKKTGYILECEIKTLGKMPDIGKE